MLIMPMKCDHVIAVCTYVCYVCTISMKPAPYDLWLMLHVGQTDTELSDKGVKQAQLLGQRLQMEGFTHVYSSDLKRCVHVSTNTSFRRCVHMSISSNFQALR